MGQHLFSLHDAGHVVPDDNHVWRDVYFTVGKGVQGINGFIGMHTARQFDLNFNLFSRIVVDGGDLDLARFGSPFHRIDQRLSCQVIGQFGDGNGLVVTLFDPGPTAQAAIAVIIGRDIHNPAAGKIRIKCKLPAV